MNRISRISLGGLCTGGTFDVKMLDPAAGLGFTYGADPDTWTDDWDIAGYVHTVGPDKNNVMQRTHTLIFSHQRIKDVGGNPLNAVPIAITLDGKVYKNDKDITGTGGGVGSEKCGNVTITDACIIEGKNAGATIGFGWPGGVLAPGSTTIYEIGDITITNSTLEDGRGGSVIIGEPRATTTTWKAGTIRINTDKSATEFFEYFDHGNPLNTDAIVGFPGAKQPNGKESEVYWNGTLVGPVITRSMVPTLP